MEKRRARRLLEAVLNLPFLAWVLVGFSLSYLFFFVQPVFLSTDTMNFIEYVPALKPIGLDLKQMLGYSEAFTVENSRMILWGKSTLAQERLSSVGPRKSQR